MSIANKYNRGSLFNARPQGTEEYFSLEELFNQNRKEHTVLALYLNTKGKFGTTPTILTGDCFINLPQHLTDTISEMIHDSEVIEAVNNGNLGIEIYEYFSTKYNKKCYSINWVDLA